MKKTYKKKLKQRRNENQEATPPTTTTTINGTGNEKDDKMKTYTQNGRLRAQEIGVYAQYTFILKSYKVIPIPWNGIQQAYTQTRSIQLCSFSSFKFLEICFIFFPSFFSSFTSFARICFGIFGVFTLYEEVCVSHIELPYMCMVILCLRRSLVLCFHFVACEQRLNDCRWSSLFVPPLLPGFMSISYFNTNPRSLTIILSHSFHSSCAAAQPHIHAFQFTLYTPIQCAPSHLLRPNLLSVFFFSSSLLKIADFV